MTLLDSLSKKSKVLRSNNRSSRIDFLMKETKVEPTDLKYFERPKISQFSLLKILLVLILIFLITGAMYLSEIVFSTSNDSLAALNKFNPFKQLAQLVTSADKRLAGESRDRINFLLLGIGGAGHEGPYLTDTIMVASLKPSTAEVALISLPRDLLVEVASGQWQKINQVYALGKVQKNDGAKIITDVIEKNFDLNINYYAIIDFAGFEKFIDDLGGIEINVERSFIDNQYPTENFSTTTIAFATGPQIMDGQTALIFARSRHGTNFEGSDFARSKRQQLILQAVRDKVLSLTTLFSPTRISSIFNLLENHLETNLSVWQALKLSQLAQNIADENIYRLVLDDSPTGFLEASLTGDGAYILQPKNGDYEKLQQLVNNVFDFGKLKDEAAKIEVQNGTPTPGLAYFTFVYLQKLNYNIVKFGNALTQDYQRTIIYDFTDGQKKETLKCLKEELGAYVAKTIPVYITNYYQTPTSTSPTAEIKEKPDLLVILGLDQTLRFDIPEPVPELNSATSTEETATSAKVDE